MKVTYIMLDLEISTSRNISQENKFVKMYKGEGNGGGGTTTFNNSIKRKKNQELLIFPISHAYMRYMLINLFIKKKINSTSNYTMEH